jgi:hypothetical protein
LKFYFTNNNVLFSIFYSFIFYLFIKTTVIESLVAAMLVEKGLIKYETLIKDVWPGFEQNGKGEITFRRLMAHAAGLSAFNETYATTNH